MYSPEILRFSKRSFLGKTARVLWEVLFRPPVRCSIGSQINPLTGLVCWTLVCPRWSVLLAVWGWRPPSRDSCRFNPRLGANSFWALCRGETTWEGMSSLVPFFCGEEPSWQRAQSETASFNVDRAYPKFEDVIHISLRGCPLGMMLPSEEDPFLVFLTQVSKRLKTDRL